ncbi:MAG: DEAD/DEAH box helicase family protein [Lachnospiraceae bacterium]|nr:DEAD/DEAH box helicase family protein [Lachnospiraceae bacterium]
MIYAYTTPEIKRHDGWTKIGYTEQDVDKRLEQQTHTADVEYKEEWRGTAIFDDGSGETFHDTDFHAYLRKNGIENDKTKDNEWFHVTGPVSRGMFFDFKSNRGVLKTTSGVVPYSLRNEQKEAVEKAFDYFAMHENGEFLWNAKPRFGKTLGVYDLCMTLGAERVLVVTNRPAIANSWYEDYERFVGTEHGYRFVSTVDGIKDRPLVMTRQEYIMELRTRNEGEEYGCIEFVSLQDLKGSKYFGGKYDKLREVADLEWDILVIDEAHEGVDTYKTDVAFDHIKRKHTLHLSGTPFKALANEKFPANAIYNWTYADEQKAKRDWKQEVGTENPYQNLPQLNMFTYQMSEIIRDELEQGTEVQGETVEYAFDLNEFFSTNESGRFTHNDSVNRFLDAMTTQEKFPFSTPELRDELKHTLWLLNRVDSAKALAKKLEKHPVFKDYKVVLAAGDGRMDDDEEAAKSFDRVKEAIANYDKTITLSVGQLTTGVTIKEWTAVLMLSSIKSPALYMQAAFRAQNPCLFTNGKEFFRKKNAYVFDFDPARTLIIFEQFANDLSESTSSGKGDTGTREEHIRELLNFFPVIGEDENGEMIQLDAEKVLSIPRKIKSKEVVRRGFMSDFLFQNISNVFHAPQEVLDIITAIDPAKDPGDLTTSTGEELSLNDDGEVELAPELVIGTAAETFGEKIFSKAADKIDDILDTIQLDQVEADLKEQRKREEAYLEQLKQTFHTNVTDKVMETASEKYGSDMTKSTQNALQKKLNNDADSMLNRAFGDLRIQQATLEADMQDALDTATKEEAVEIKKTFEEKKKQVVEDFKEAVAASVEDMVKSAGEEVVRRVETDKKEAKKRTIEDGIRDHLRGFSRTIPSFLMAYGEENEVTLDTFDLIIPDNVFIEVTSITLDQFRFLRDGGPYTNAETGKEEFFKGHLFDPVVFNDSVKEFLVLKKRLADYFDEASTEDIFDYIPPQKTNQIFTPKRIVKDMVDRLEKENPGCFDDQNKTFADLYMKSGMYIAEIVKRLYQSEQMKALYPDSHERLRHIFEKQVFGLAPTEIIYRISLAYILGFTEEIEIQKHNIRLCDSLQYAKEGTLEDKLIELFGSVLGKE